MAGENGQGQDHGAIEASPNVVSVTISIGPQGITVSYPMSSDGTMNEVLTLYLLERGKMIVQDAIRAAAAPRVAMARGGMDSLKKFLPRNLG